MGQVIAFANNQIVFANGGVGTITTDPVPLDGYDRATAHLLVENIFNAAAGCGYAGQVSNDGVNWIAVTALTDATATTNVVKSVTADVNGAFLRFQLTFANAAGFGAGCMDLHVLLDHK